MSNLVIKGRSLGVNVSFDTGLSTAEDFDRAVGKQGACLESACTNVAYRSSGFPDFRDKFAAKLVELTGIPMKETGTGKNDSEGNEIMQTETEDAYKTRLQRVELKLSDEQWQAKFQSVADQVCAAIKFDPKAAERKPAQPKKLPQDYLDAAKRVLGNPNSDWRKLITWELTGDTEKDATQLGWAIRAEILRREEEARKQVG